MALGIYLGGTTGAADGTLEVPGDGVGLTLGAIGSVGTFHIRAASGKQNAEQVTVNAPVDCEVSTDGSTYGPTAVYAAGAIQDVNVACHLRRNANTLVGSIWTGVVVTPRIAAVVEEAIPAVVIYSEDFSAVSDGASVLGTGGWERDTGIANNLYSTFLADTLSGEKMCEIATSASDASTRRAYMKRDFASPVDLSLGVLVALRMALGTLSSVSLALGSGGADFISIQLTGTALQAYNGSSWVDVVTGLSAGAIYDVVLNVRQGDTSHTITVNGVDYTGVSTRAAVPTSLDKMYTGGGASSGGLTAYVGGFEISEAV